MATKKSASPRTRKLTSRDVITNLPPAREADVTAFLRAAVKADPSTREGKAALRAAESAALRIARDLRRQARASGGVLGEVLEQRANENLFRAVLAAQLPRLGQLMRRPLPTPPQPLAAPLLTDPPAKPTGVFGVPGQLSAVVHWTEAVGEIVLTFTVKAFIGGVEQFETVVAGAQRQTTLLGLTAGTAYQFRVIASNLNGDSDPSDPSDPVTPLGLEIPPVGTSGLLDLPLPAFSSDPALLIDQTAEPFRAIIADAARIAQKWRYEHLKIQALAAAREAMQYEEHIARLMSMALDKLGTAEEILNSTLLQGVATIQNTASGLAEAAESPELDSLLDPLGDTAAQSLLLPKFFAWLIEKGPLSFWIGLFEAIISDLASVFPGSSTGLGRTRRYIRNAFKTNLDDVQADLKKAADDIIARLDSEIERMVAPLRAATSEVIAGTKKAMADVFESSDITLLLTPSDIPGQPGVPDVDPFEDLYAQLDAQVNQLAAKVKEKVIAALEPLTNLADGGALFETIVITFLVLPILAFLVISLAGGPFSAAILAAAVLLAAEELLRLLVQWLAGPLLKKINELQERLTELVGRLQSFFALQAHLVQINNPAEVLRILASELRQLSDFLPQAFLEEAAGVLQEARNVVLRTATQLGLAAEQALGAENATAFEAIREDYATNLIQAAQLPGGSDPSRLAGAALLRDLGRLEEQRTSVRDGKEIEFTHRVSLLRLLGGATSIQQFLQRRELLVSLTENDLIDRMFPGVYRAVIKDVRATGILGGVIDPRLHGIPLSITHLGESRTRIKRGANPFAPPLELPNCFPTSERLFARRVVGPALLQWPGFTDVLQDEIERIFNTVPLFTVAQYVLAFLVGVLSGMSFEQTAEILGRPFRDALLTHLPDALERAAVDQSCGLVDPASIGAATRALLGNKSSALGEVMLPVLLQSVPGSNKPDLQAALEPLANLLRDGFVFENVTLRGLSEVTKEAWREGKAAFVRRIARWGDVDFEEDPDSQVRALGFIRLLRRGPSETMVCNLFPSDTATVTRAHSAAGVSDGNPFMPASSLQYRAFENRGIEGDLLVRLEALEGVGGGLASQLSANLTDVVLDITIRGCYDADLAQTVRASRNQTAKLFSLASSLPGALDGVALPGALVRLESGASELRTVRYSLRSHRDRMLQTITAAILAQNTPPADLTNLIAGKSMLARDTPFEPIDPAVTTFALELSSAPLANTVETLTSLVGKVRVAPGDLGFDAAIPAAEAATLVSLGVAVIPMPGGVRPDDPIVDGSPLPDPIDVQLQVTGLLGNVLPGFAAPTPFPERIKMTLPAQVTDAPAIADLFAAAIPPTITLDLADALGPPSLLYDVIVTMTFRVPALKVRTAIEGLR